MQIVFIWTNKIRPLSIEVSANHHYFQIKFRTKAFLNTYLRCLLIFLVLRYKSRFIVFSLQANHINMIFMSANLLFRSVLLHFFFPRVDQRDFFDFFSSFIIRGMEKMLSKRFIFGYQDHDLDR